MDVVRAKRTLLADRDRVRTIVGTLAKYGYSAWAVGVPPDLQAFTARLSSPDLLELSDGERVRRACLELGVTFIKIGQLLSTRSDIVGPEIPRFRDLYPYLAERSDRAVEFHFFTDRLQTGRTTTRPLRGNYPFVKGTFPVDRPVFPFTSRA